MKHAHRFEQSQGNASPDRNIAPGEDSAFPRGDASRRALLLAGAKIFSEKGLEGATTREIAAEAGQNIAMIAYYFKGKDGLYLAIAQEIADQMSQRMRPFLQEIDTGKQLTPDDAHVLLRRLVSQMVHAILSSRNPFAQIILREQQHPSEAFEILYAGGMGQVHEQLNRLVACMLKRSPQDKDVIVRSHALFGQIIGFRAARALVLRRAGWSDFGDAEIELIERGILANVDSLRAAGTPASTKTSSRAASPRSSSKTKR